MNFLKEMLILPNFARFSEIFGKMFGEFFGKILTRNCDCRAVQRSALCRSRRELSNAYFLAKFGFDTAENEPLKARQLDSRAGEPTTQATPGRGFSVSRSPSASELKGSIGEGSNHSNFSGRSSVRILSKLRNFR